MFCVISAFENLSRFVLWPWIWSILVSVPQEECIRWNILQYQSSQLVDGVFQFCNFAAFLFVLLITERGMLNSSPIIADFSISPFNFINFRCKILKLCCQAHIYLEWPCRLGDPFITSRTVTGLRFYPAWKLTGQPFAASWCWQKPLAPEWP